VNPIIWGSFIFTKNQQHYLMSNEIKNGSSNNKNEQIAPSVSQNGKNRLQ